MKWRPPDAIGDDVIESCQLNKKPRYNGPEYRADRDNVRLAGQMARIYDCISDGHWRTITEISSITGDPENSVAAQLRHLRKERFGAHNIERRSRYGQLYEYRLND
jgi:allophanate hydrolase subunit 1